MGNDLAPAIRRGPMSPIVRPALLASALLMIAVGVVLYLTVDEVVGVVIAALGFIDLLTMPFVLGIISRNRSGSSGAVARPPAAEPDRDYNPYARED